MCHSCLLGDRKYIHELPDPTTLEVKTEDLIQGKYNWDPEYFYVAMNPEKFSGIIFNKKDEEYEPAEKAINETFPHKII